MTMNPLHPARPYENVSAFGVVNESFQEILRAEAEDRKISKSTIRDRERELHQYREERIKNLEQRLKMLAGGRKGCYKYLKVITIVVGALAAPFTGGTSLAGATAITMALTIAQAALSVASAITGGLEKLKNALHQKKIMLKQSEGEQILALIEETNKWMEDEKAQLSQGQERKRASLEEQSQTLKELDNSFRGIIKI